MHRSLIFSDINGTHINAAVSGVAAAAAAAPDAAVDGCTQCPLTYANSARQVAALEAFMM